MRSNGTRTHLPWLWIVVAITWMVALSLPSQAQTFTVLHNFNGGSDGSTPYAGVTLDRGGNIYGTTRLEGHENCSSPGSCGIVYKLTHSGSGWILTTLYEFQGAGVGDGANPTARVVFGPDGALYGTTEFGGQGNQCDGPCGTVFRLTPPAASCRSTACPWAETVLHDFQGGNDGGFPWLGDVVFDRNGNLYGTTIYGGGGYCYSDGCGTVYEMSHSSGGWSEQLLFPFYNGPGSLPMGGVTLDGSGNLYGATSIDNYDGNPVSYSAVYELTSDNGNWTVNSLFTFSNEQDDGTAVAGAPIFDQAGNLYGATSVGGPLGGGSVFELTPSGGGWNFTLLHAFSYSGDARSPGPLGSLTMDAAGNLYGTTYADGANGCGAVFKLTPANGTWTYTSLHDFTCHNDGGNPYGNVSFDSAGNIYGTASVGGTQNRGVVWEITP